MNTIYKYLPLSIILTFFIFLKIQADESFWECLYGPENGTVYNISVNQNNDIYCSSDNGIFKSTNHGNTWFDILVAVNINELSISNKNVIIAKHNVYNPDKSFFYRSTNDGRWWDTILSLYQYSTFSPYIIGFDFEENLYINIKKDSIREYYISKDYGNSWKPYKIILENFSDSFFIRSFRITKNKHPYFLANCYDENMIFYSMIGISSKSDSAWEYIKIQDSVTYCIVFDIDKILITVKDSIRYTSDQGKNWINIMIPTISDIHSFYFTRYNGIYYYDGLNLFYSGNFGYIWDKIEGINHSVLYCFSEDSSGIQFFGTFLNGIYKSTDMGKSWEKNLKGFTAGNVKSIIFDENNNNYIACWGIYKSTDNGKHWLNRGFNEWYLTSVIKDGMGYIYTSGYLGSVFRSKNDGINWDTITEGIPDNISLDRFIINKRGFVLGSSPFPGYFLSTNHGEAWQEKDKNGITTYLFGMNSKGHIFRADEWGKISRSTDDGETWQQVGFGYCPGGYRSVDGEKQSKILFDPKGNVGWVGCMKTTDNGSYWYPKQPFDPGPPDCIDSLGNYWSIWSNLNSLTSKTMKSTDKGITWVCVDSSVKHLKWNFMKVAPNGYLYAAAYNGGLYRSRERFVSVKENMEPEIHNAIIIIPNPATDETTITYNLRKPGNVTLTLADILGREVAVLVKDSFMENGSHNCQLSIVD